MAKIECNVQCFFRRIDQYGQLCVSMSKKDKERVIGIMDMLRKGANIKLPVYKDQLFTIKVDDYKKFPVKELKSNQRMDLRVCIRKYKFNGREGISMKLCHADVYIDVEEEAPAAVAPQPES
jgi:hypothetical protein